MNRLAAAFLLLTLAACSPSSDNDPTGSVNLCAAKFYSPYNSKDMKQCVDVCIRCDRGAMTTCSTSCTLKGAR
jgi:hypothetical protein